MCNIKQWRTLVGKWLLKIYVKSVTINWVYRAKVYYLEKLYVFPQLSVMRGVKGGKISRSIELKRHKQIAMCIGKSKKGRIEDIERSGQQGTRRRGKSTPKTYSYHVPIHIREKGRGVRKQALARVTTTCEYGSQGFSQPSSLARRRIRPKAVVETGTSASS